MFILAGRNPRSLALNYSPLIALLRLREVSQGGGRRGGGGNCLMKVTKILAISFRVDCRLWSQVGYSGQKAKIFTIDVLLRVVCVEIP